MSDDNVHVGIQCPKCKELLFSMSRHDFHYCLCGACFIDGGRDYLSYGWSSDINAADIKRVTKSHKRVKDTKLSRKPKLGR